VGAISAKEAAKGVAGLDGLDARLFVGAAMEFAERFAALT
jgi:hypothetical protein